MSTSSSSRKWLARQKKDPYVKKAKAEGYRSRAAFKLIEIQDKYQIIKPGMRLLELGCAPGSWTELLAEWVGQKGLVHAIDLLDMPPIDNVDYRQGDIESDETWRWCEKVAAGGLDMILSDMAPNMCGHQRTDQLRSERLVDMAYEISRNFLGQGGGFLVKTFHSAGFNTILKELRLSFKQVKVIKPDASRKASGEIYLLAMGKKQQVDRLEEIKDNE